MRCDPKEKLLKPFPGAGAAAEGVVVGRGETDEDSIVRVAAMRLT